MKARHIAVGVGSLFLSRGGTERAAVYLAEAMITRGHRVTLFYLPHPRNRPTPVYTVHPACAVVSGPTQRHEDIRNMREILRACDVDVFLSMESSAAHLLWAVSVLGTGIPFICSERHHPRYIEEHFWNRPGRMAVLGGADFIHELFPEYLQHVPEIWRDKARAIGNSAPVGSVVRAWPAGEREERKILLYLARLKAPKRPDLLIRAFALLKDEFPDWHLHLWGHGPLVRPLRALIRKLKLDAQARILGETHDALSLYAEAHLYCLPSEEEGFPNSILEAMNAGLPCVAFGGCAGAAALIEDQVNGALAAEMTAESLAASLKPLMASRGLRTALGEAGRQRAAEYASERVFDQWEMLLEEAAACKGHTVMDGFREDPFACRSTLSAAARREWIFRDFGQPMPHSLSWARDRLTEQLDLATSQEASGIFGSAMKNRHG
ncbi:MAG: glycosyltransferase [Deltaproteobacteria bacterium]|jgi:glycosyltransferase involved in cell wall biosynthesis|nr:glycosyltransferase [Deltaproteobacteria bacterium]